MITGKEITILGAGVAGLTLARALALRGARVTVLEQADAIREVGAGVQVSPNAVAVLRDLGLLPALEAVSTRADYVRLCNGETGAQVVQMDLARLRPDHGYHFVHRADLIALLAAGAKEAGAEVTLLQRIEAVDLSHDKPHLVMADGTVRVVDLVIGADGLHSKTRSALNGKALPFFTRQVAWRMVVPNDPADPAGAEVHMGAGRHLVSYPLRGGAWRNIVAVEERKSWVEESWTLRDDPMEMRLAFAGFSPRVQDWLNRADDVGLWGLFRHPVAARWFKVMGQGGAAILGDAAHPTLPFLAQGAAMAMEDAWVLADLLGRMTVEAALPAYQAKRLTRTSRIVQAASSNARIYHMAGPLRGILHAGLRISDRIAPDFALSRFDWLYDHDVTKAGGADAPRGIFKRS